MKSSLTAFMMMLVLAANGPTLAQTPAPPQPQPPPFSVPNPATPAASAAPGQQQPPRQQQPAAGPDGPLPNPSTTTIESRPLKPLAVQPPTPTQVSPNIERAEGTAARPAKESPPPFDTRIFSLIGPYRATALPKLPLTSPLGSESFIREGKLYLSLRDAIVLAIQNSLDVEVNRYNLLLADTDLVRAKGGGSLRGLDYNVEEPPSGVEAATSPLLITATTGNATSTNAAVTDLSQVTQSGSSVQQDLSVNGISSYSAGPNIPVFDPTVSGEVGFLRRSDESSLDSSNPAGGGASNSSTSHGPLDFLSTGLEIAQGFSTGAELDTYIDNAPQVLYGGTSQFDPFAAPSFSVTLSQPLLRGRGRQVNLRFIHIAQLDQRIARLVFEQQLLETVYGVARLYYDLVSLGENVGVKQETLAAAQKLYDDDKSQVDLGTLAPVELTRARALVSSSRLDLIQAESEYRQEEVIIREQVLRRLGDPGAIFSTIVPTDRIDVPSQPPNLDVSILTTDALANRPDLAQAGLQIHVDEIAVRASRNGVRPQLNAYANIQTRGSSIVPYETLGSPGTGMLEPPPLLTQGGLSVSTIYQAGIQLNLPIRNRIAPADAARDQIQLRQAQARAAKLENDLREQIESAVIALENAHQAYAAAVESRDYQQQLLQAEIDKLSVGASTNFMIVHDEAFLAQARSSEVAARSDWMKAQLSLDRAMGDLLERNNIVLEDAIKSDAQ